MPQASEVWDRLSNVERTALQVSLYRCDGERSLLLPDGEPFYDGSIDRRLVAACMPEMVQQEYRAQQNKQFQMSRTVGFRTAAIDFEVMRRVSTAGVRQVVILGAGLDARAWRLPWPETSTPETVTTIIEVDTGSLEHFKTTQLAAIAPLPPTCRLKFIAADVSQAEELQQGLAAAGLDASKPVVWVLEGLVGYLKAEDSMQLFKTMLAMCRPESAAIVTAPPTRQKQQDAAGLGHRLHHATFETADSTLARLTAAGWEAAFLDVETAGPRTGITWRQLAGPDELQELIIACKPASKDADSSSRAAAG